MFLTRNVIIYVCCKFTNSPTKRNIKTMMSGFLRVNLVFILSVFTLYTPSVSQWYFAETPRPLHKPVAYLRPLPPSTSLTNIYANNLVAYPADTANKPSSPFSKRFLSSETKESMGGISVASNSYIHDNYISQQYKWSNR